MHGNKLSNSEIIKIYEKILLKKRLFKIPFTVSIKGYGLYGLQSWSAVRQRALRIKANK